MLLASYLDLGRNELRNALFQNLSSAPSSISTDRGRFYYDTSTSKLRVFDGTTWSDVGGGSVSSVALSLPSIFTVSGSPVTSSGTLTGTLATQTANTIFAGPTSGGVATPTFRTLAQADIPASIPLSYWSAATADIALGGFKITGIADATANTDVPSWLQVQNLFQGVRDYKESVRLASTANVSVTYNSTGGTSARGQITAAPNTLNGTTLVAGDRILLKDQTVGAQNGIWVVTTVGSGSTGIWDRATDFDQDSEVTSGATTFVSSFTTLDNRGTYVLTTQDPIVIGGASGTALAFTYINSIGGYIAGAGLTLTGLTFDVVSSNTAIVVNANDIALTLATNSGLQISSGLKIQSDSVTSNTIGLQLTSSGAGLLYNSASFTGTTTLALAAGVAGDGLALTSGILSVNVDGTSLEITSDSLNVKAAGITQTHIASSALGTTLTGGSGTVLNVANYTVVSGTTVARKYTAAITLATGAYTNTVTHNLGTADVQVYVYETTTNTFILTEVTHTSSSVVTISGTNNTGATIPSRCVVVG